ncbi:hypothetical protein [Actinoplanes aureus]|uniref:Uncharacterized protein n=1 Tax=Actinoplanes aureus TaxID=2792083 RepID=A0A931CBI1_9ACTN|nr:hypothetical protein [Actinoplanes aureus]MBG0561850.1 hypothetical protein [Actinoplanes aureus]
MRTLKLLAAASLAVAQRPVPTHRYTGVFPLVSSLRKRAGHAAVAAVAGVASMLMLASPAGATSSRPAEATGASDMVAGPVLLAADDCTVGATSTGCRTGAIPAAGGRIYIIITKPVPTIGCSFRVVDVVNGAVVRSGTFVYGYRYPSTITGLYSSYRLELFNCLPGSAGFIGDRP